MRDYYFTFGQDHHDKDGRAMKDRWVRVVAESYDKARSIFIREYAIPIMGDACRWSFMYEGGFFEPEWFPAGEDHIIYQSINPIVEQNEEF